MFEKLSDEQDLNPIPPKLFKGSLIVAIVSWTIVESRSSISKSDKIVGKTIGLVPREGVYMVGCWKIGGPLTWCLVKSLEMAKMQTGHSSFEGVVSRYCANIGHVRR